jgi:glutaminyl-peptide cyclotransferase
VIAKFAAVPNFACLPFVRRICFALEIGAIFFCDGCNRPPQLRGGEPWKEFSGENALQQVQQLVDFGPRPPGSEALEKSRGYITKQLELSGWQVTRQTFTEETPRGKVQFVNLLARPSSRTESNSAVFLLCSHYDTKVFDSIRFVGANDGGSSTGALLEIARVLALHPGLATKTLLVFFDGEEAYENFSETDGLYGSRYFAANLPQPKNKFLGGLLLDMVGDRSLTITLSPDSPPQMTLDIFASAEALKLRNHFTYFQTAIMDDHTPLNAAGITTIDLIDFDFPAWHTADDTMDKISAASLDAVGAVTLYYLSEFALK